MDSRRSAQTSSVPQAALQVSLTVVWWRPVGWPASPSAADCGDAGMELTLDIADKLLF
jgi:hypothetical protein